MTHHCYPRALLYLMHERVATTRDDQIDASVLGKGRGDLGARVSTVYMNVPVSSAYARAAQIVCTDSLPPFVIQAFACASAVIVTRGFAC